MERIIGTRIPRTPVPRDAPAFLAEQERFLAAQRDPGPPQPGHGTSKKRR
jgi:ATP-dependent RNA helicase RhlE